MAGRAALTLILTVLLTWLGRWTPSSGDSLHMAYLAGHGWTVTMHSTLTSLIHRLVYLTLAPFGFDAWHAISVSGSLAGALALQLLFAHRRHPLFLIANICAGSFLVFVGEVENYAWVNLFLLAAFIWIEPFLQKRAPAWPALTCFFLAVSAHMLALFYLPPLLWLIRRRTDVKPWELAAPLFVFLAFSTLGNALLPHEGIELSLTRLVPLFHIERKDQWFTFFSRAHLEIKTYYLFKAGIFFLPLGWPIVLILRRKIDSPFKRFLLHCAVIGFIWNTLWHPDMGWRDWDLFSQAAIPLHFLVGELLADQFPLKSGHPGGEAPPASSSQ